MAGIALTHDHRQSQEPSLYAINLGYCAGHRAEMKVLKKAFPAHVRAHLPGAHRAAHLFLAWVGLKKPGVPALLLVVKLRALSPIGVLHSA